jgi:predicted transcriptional regulator
MHPELRLGCFCPQTHLQIEPLLRVDFKMDVLDRQVSRHLLLRPGDSLKQIAKELDAKPSAVGRSLTRLASKGIAQLRTVGREQFPQLTLFTKLGELEAAIADLRLAC